MIGPRLAGGIKVLVEVECSWCGHEEYSAQKKFRSSYQTMIRRRMITNKTNPCMLV